ncbi:MAG: bifunctional oligoribonuclease/PAP phosphatase NrnA [Thermodesulfovibrionales bacterium]|nr:bifunctional oligoribonuclease/PAP phosphatase NrnA [Thermodesulfovibrionales bacterium]MDP3111805.1 bifunctional oligoribonuclease/PAP phosphatase NrnA [Thermodesulfovibrionales bacterium]
MNIPENLLDFLRKGKQFFIATHISPDGDALGSSIALSLALESLGKETIIYDKDPVPEFYKFLPGHKRFTNSVPLKSSTSNLILLDCNELERTGIEKIEFVSSAVIDHHETEKEFGDIKWIEPHAAATGLMLFYIIKELGVKITKDIAINLYAAIAIDTGTFRYSNTTPEVLRVAAELIEAGADPSYIAESLYETWSESRFRLLLKVLNTLEINNSIAITLVTLDIFRETGASVEDTENFVGFPRLLKSVNISVLFREIENNFYKVSLRSKGKEMNVAKIAAAFGGGGHRNAAGCKIRSDFKTAKEKLLKAIRESH